MSEDEDKDIEPKEIIDDPKKETVRRLFNLGTQIIETAAKIDWQDYNDHALQNKLDREGLSCYREDGQPKIIFLVTPYDRRDQGLNLTLYNQKVNQITFGRGDHFGVFQKFFRDTPIYNVSLESHEDYPSESVQSYTYALSAGGEVMRASWEDTFIPDQADYTSEVDLGEIEVVGAAMNRLRGQLEKFSPTTAVSEKHIPS